MDGGMVPIEGDDDETDGGAAEQPCDPREPLRRCIVSGTVQPKEGMLRFVIGPDGDVVPDLEGRLPGRGLWVTADRAVVERAVARKVFARAARRAVQVAPGLADRLAVMLERRCLDLIGLARRAGQVVVGFDSVRAALKTGRVGHGGPPGLLLAASDGAEDGRSKLRALATGLPVVEEFGAAALGAALGRDLAVHAVLARGRLADCLKVEAARCAGLKLRPAGPVSGGQIGLTTDQSDTND